MMAPTEDFWNLQSKFRGKKEFNFYDKMVPQPFKITPSATPTPSITPTPSVSCIVDGSCFIFGAGSNTITDNDGNTYNVSGVYEPISGSVISGSPGNYSIVCNGNPTDEIYVNRDNGKIFAVVDESASFGYFGYGYDTVDGIAKTITCGVTFENFDTYIGGITLYPITENCGSYYFVERTTSGDSITYTICPTPSVTPTTTPTVTPSITPSVLPSPTPSPSPINANGFKITNSTLEGGDMNGTYVLARDDYYDEFAGSTGGLSYQGWGCINPATFTEPYGNLYKNINNDEKFINVESFNGGNIVRLRKGGLTSQVPSDPNNPFSCNTRLYDVDRDYGYTYTGEATTYCGYSFPLSGSTSFGDVEWLDCI